MEPEVLSSFGTTLLHATAPGGAGGLASFLFALKRGHYRNNKYTAKFLIEILGAMVTGTFVASFFGNWEYVAAVAFAVGLTWAQIIHVIRTKITKIVEAALGESFEGGSKR